MMTLANNKLVKSRFVKKFRHSKFTIKKGKITFFNQNLFTNSSYEGPSSFLFVVNIAVHFHSASNKFEYFVQEYDWC